MQNSIAATSVNVMRRVRQEIRYLRAILRDPRTPAPAKWFIGAGVAYLVSPIDLVPDVIPVIGQLDDVLIVPTLVGLGLAAVPEAVKKDHRRRTASQSTGRFGDAGSMRFETDALPGSFGVRVVDVDTGDAHGTEVLLGLLELVLEHRVVVSSGLVGERLLDSISPGHRETDGFVATDLSDPGGRLENHIIGSEARVPASLAGRFQIEIASGEGDAQFIDLVAAYDGLSESKKQAIDSLMVWPHRPSRNEPANPRDFRHLVIGEGADSDSEAEARAYPLVPRHAVTGVRSLTPHLGECEIVGLEEGESSDLLSEVREHAERPEFSCEPKSDDGDLITRDEASTMMPRDS